MTTANRTNGLTAEQIIEDALRNSYASGSALARLIVSDLHAHDMLSEGAPSEAQVEAAAKALTDAADELERANASPNLIELEARYSGFYSGIRLSTASNVETLRARAAEIRGWESK